MTLTRWVLGAEMVPRVVHRLPGRVRLRIQALTRIPPEHRSVVEDRLNATRLPEGLLDLQVSVLTGSLVVRYDPDRHDEGAVVAWVESVAQAARAEIERLLDMTPAARARAAQEIRRRLEDGLVRGRLLGPELLEVAHARSA